jgi:hypothetical protein
VGTEADQQYKTALEVLTANAVVADAA